MSGPFRLIALALVLALGAVACAGEDPVEVVVEDATAGPNESEDQPAEGATEDEGDKPGQRGELALGDDKLEPELGTVATDENGTVAVNAGAPAAQDGRLCAVLPTGRVEEVMGGEADVQDNTPDTCVYTRLMGGEAIVATVTRTDILGEFPFQTLVDTQAESLDRDGVADAMDGLGDEAYVIDGELGTYVHALAGDLYLVVFVTGPINSMAAAESLTRVALEG